MLARKLQVDCSILAVAVMSPTTVARRTRTLHPRRANV